MIVHIKYILIVILIIFLKFLLVDRRVVSFNPFNNFFLVNISIFISTIYIVYDTIIFYESLLNYFSICAFTLILGSFFSRVVFKYSFKEEPIFQNTILTSHIHRRKWNFIHFLFWLFVILISIILTSTSGVIPLKSAILFFTDSKEEAAKFYINSRIEISHGKEYVAPGYVNQLKDYVLTFLTVVFLFHSKINPTKKNKFYAYTSFIITTIFLLSSGTRSGLIFFFFSLFLFLNENRAFFKKNIISIYLYGFIAIIFLALLTILMGRTSEEDGNLIIASGIKIIERIASITAEENIKIYDLFLRQRNTDFLKDWLLTLSTFLPGQQVPMSIHFAKIVGYSRGNVPLHYWTGLYYNFGMVGPIISLIWGFILQSTYVLYIRRKKTILKYTAWSLALIYLGFAIDPAGLLLYGFFTTLVFGYLCMLNLKIGHE